MAGVPVAFLRSEPWGCQHAILQGLWLPELRQPRRHSGSFLCSDEETQVQSVFIACIRSPCQ